jgi:hypothetical protein
LEAAEPAVDHSPAGFLPFQPELVEDEAPSDGKALSESTSRLEVLWERDVAGVGGSVAVTTEDMVGVGESEGPAEGRAAVTGTGDVEPLPLAWAACKD